MSGPSDWNEWNRQIIEEFRANGGKVGGRFEGQPLLLVHHVGARTGTPRVNPLGYFQDGDRMIIVASKGGAPTNPDWYYNLKATPRTEVEVGTERFAVEATEVTGEERDEVWKRLTAALPAFADYQRNTERTIPLIALTRTG